MTSVLFLCPHNAAKSVTAATYLGGLAADAGVDITIDTAGTDPDAEVLPLVRNQLESDGFVVDTVPRLVTAADLARADVIVNIGCPLSELDTTKDIINWGIPNFSEDPAAAFGELSDHATALFASLQSGSIQNDDLSGS